MYYKFFKKHHDEDFIYKHFNLLILMTTMNISIGILPIYASYFGSPEQDTKKQDI